MTPSPRCASFAVFTSLFFGCSGVPGVGPIVQQGFTELTLDPSGSGLATVELPSLDALVQDLHDSPEATVVEGPTDRGSELAARILDETQACFSMAAYRSEDLAAPTMKNMLALTEEQGDNNPYNNPERLTLHLSGGLVLETEQIKHSDARQVTIDVSVPRENDAPEVVRETVMFYTFESCFDVPEGALRDAEWVELVTQIPKRRETFRFRLRT